MEILDKLVYGEIILRSEDSSLVIIGTLFKEREHFYKINAHGSSGYYRFTADDLVRIEQERTLVVKLK